MDKIRNVTTVLNPLERERLAALAVPLVPKERSAMAFTIKKTPISWNVRAEETSDVFRQKHLLEGMGEVPEDPVDSSEPLDLGALTVSLMNHQTEGVKWLIRKEKHGCILADDMGLGKTVQLIALLVAAPPPQQSYQHSTRPSAISKTTLIVVPIAVMEQWKSEIETKTRPGHLSVYLHHGTKRTKDPTKLMQYDVVLTTYGLVTSSLAEGEEESQDVLARVHWFRIVLDEAHKIKNYKSKAAKACTNLKAQRRVCLTGTPLQNNIEELFSFVRFLQVPAYKTIGDFKRIANKHNQSRLQELLSSIMLRRTKTGLAEPENVIVIPDDDDQSVELDSPPLATRNATVMPDPDLNEPEKFSFSMPPKTISDISVSMYPQELKIYQEMEARNQLQIRENGEEMNQIALLALLLKLRQICNHPDLPQYSASGNGRNIDDLDDLKLETAETAPAAADDDDLDGLGDIMSSMSLKAPERKVEPERKLESVLPWEKPRVLPSFKKKPVEEKLPDTLDALDELDALISGMHIADPAPLVPVPPAVEPLPEESFTVESVAPSSEEIDRPCLTCGNGSKELDVHESKRVICVECGYGLANSTNDTAEQAHGWKSSSKVDKIMKLIKDRMKVAPDDKFIVFSQWTSMLDILGTALSKNDIQFCRYDGKMTNIVKERSLTQFRNDPNCSVCIMSLMCGSLGINLTCANNVILTDLWWNPMIEDQAIDRAFRIGQKKPVFVYRMIVEHTVEERIVALQNRKRELVESTIGGKHGFKAKKLTFAEMAGLLGI
ncbi:hypothetical protein HDU78_011071 [Chytriomyces hyalinus]|nr:hypothetical protein HDU78_011071 [Chytriomyces hyalinus]